MWGYVKILEIKEDDTKMKKIILTCILIVAFVGVSISSTLAYSVDSIEFWSTDGFSPVSGVTEVAKLYEEAWREFEKKTGIKIKHDLIRGGTEGYQQILAAVAANNLPDVAILDGFWVPRIAVLGALQPLNGLWPEEDRKDFHPAVIEAVTIDDNIYALWFYNAYRGLFYRRDMIEEIGYNESPTEWNEFVEMCKKLTNEERYAVMFPGTPSETTTLHMLPIFMGYGGRLVDEDGKPILHEGENREALKKTYKHFYDLVNVHEVMPYSIVTIDEGDLRRYFYADEVAMIGTTSSSLMQYKQERPDIYECMDVTSHPMLEGYTAIPTLVGWTYAIFTEEPEKKQAAWDFIAHMTRPELLGTLNKAHGHLPVRRSIYDTVDLFKEDPIFRRLRGITFEAEIRPRPPVPIYITASSLIALYLEPILSGELDIEEAIDIIGKEAIKEWERLEVR